MAKVRASADQPRGCKRKWRHLARTAEGFDAIAQLERFLPWQRQSWMSAVEKAQWLQERVQPPWAVGGEARTRQAARLELLKFNPLWQYLGRCQEEGFYAFVLERELIRIRRDLGWPPEWWTASPVMAGLRLTNVKRCDDRASLAVRRQLVSLAQEWWVADGRPRQPPARRAARLEGKQRALAGLCVFNVALWRLLGTARAIESAGVVRDWSRATKMALADKLVSKVCDEEPPKGTERFMFTEAYAPTNCARSTEEKLYKARARKKLRAFYVKVLTHLDHSAWESRFKVAEPGWQHRAEQNPQHEATKAMMKVSGYGGTGFRAKEVVNDLMSTPIFSDFALVSEAKARHLSRSDVKFRTRVRGRGARQAFVRLVPACGEKRPSPTWAACGPGARKALNRIAIAQSRKIPKGAFQCKLGKVENHRSLLNVACPCRSVGSPRVLFYHFFCKEPEAEMEFVREMQSLHARAAELLPRPGAVTREAWERRGATWHPHVEALCGETFAHFDLVDTQFQLCEYDKFMRVSMRQSGWCTNARPYRPDSGWKAGGKAPAAAKAVRRAVN